MAKEPHTVRLAEFVAGLAFDHIPPWVVEHAKLCVLDTLGCGLFGSELPWSKKLVRFLGRHDSGSDARIWGTSKRASVPGAVLANGTMVHGFELDDLHKASIVHPGSVVVTTVLALAEFERERDGRDFLTAVVAGYEVGARVGKALGTSHLRRGYHPTGTSGAVASAAAAAKMLRLPAEQAVDALSIAATQAAGLMSAQFGSMVKRMHAGRAAQSGVYGALLATEGFTGIEDVFENPYGGYCSTLSDQPELELLSLGLGDEWETAKVGFKWHAACGSCHTGIDSILALRETNGLDADSVEAIEVRCSSATKEHVGWDYQPGSPTTAQMNLSYCLALALLDGEVAVDGFSEERLVSPEVLSIVGRVRVDADSEIDALGPSHRHAVQVRVKTREGGTLEIDRQSAKGSDAHPLERREVLEKYLRLAGRVVGEEVAADIRDQVFGLEASDPRSLAARLAVGQP
jgi:aconitate decarboxylase